MRVHELIAETGGRGLTEAWDRSVAGVDVHRDPSAKELAKLLHQHSSLRAFIDTTGTLWVWDGYSAVHWAVEQGMPEHPSLGGSLVLSPAGVFFNHLEDFRAGRRYAGNLRKVWTAVRQKPSLRRFYGDAVIPQGFDNETSKVPHLTPEWMEKNVGPDGEFPKTA